MKFLSSVNIPEVDALPDSGNDGDIVIYSDMIYRRVSDSWASIIPQDVATLTFVIDGAGEEIETGVKGDLAVPFACTVNSWTLMADVSGSIVVDIWKESYANYPPTDSDTITASSKPTISTSTKGQSSTLTGWTTSISAGDILRIAVTSVTDITRVSLSLKVTKT